MGKDKKIHFCFILCIVAILLFTVVSRAVGLTCNLTIHPDESEFYNGSQSLARSILDPSVPFEEEKEYPEGAYVLQLPFQLIKEFLGSSHWFWRNAQCWSRISSVFYFVLAMIYGIMILTKYMSRSKVAAVLYALTMCFSLFFIEHSRYGVGDMGSLFLLMATIYHSARAMQTKKMMHLMFAVFCTGVLGSIKYPQIYFAVIPAAVYLRMYGRDKRRAVFGMLAFVAILLLSFLMFSPKAAVDPGYILRVIDREGKAYVTEGTGFNSGGLINNIIGTVLYTLLYSDFPLSFLLVAVFFYKSVVSGSSEKEDYLFYKLLPVVTTLFFTYNLFAKLLVFRTMTPFFGMTALYASEAAGKLYCRCEGKERKVGRAVVLLLTCLMILRGGWLLQITGHQGDATDRFTPLLQSAVDENWSKVTLFAPYNVAVEYSFEDNMNRPPELPIKHYSFGRYVSENDGYTIQPGEIAITGAYEHGLNAPYFVSYKKSLTASDDAAWEAFKQANQEYYVGQIYPSGYYYIFGGWIRGGTLSTFLMPCNMVYYRST